MSIEKNYGEFRGNGITFTPVCDSCFETLPSESEHDLAVQSLRDSGWQTKSVNGDWENYCTDCRED